MGDKRKTRSGTQAVAHACDRPSGTLASKRLEFTNKTREAAWKRSNGMCEGAVRLNVRPPIRAVTVFQRCCAPIDVGNFHYDHILPAWMGGGNDLDNCQVLCLDCHKRKTGQFDIKAIAKTKRIVKKLKGLKKSRNPMPFGRDSKWRKKVNGKIVPRLK